MSASDETLKEVFLKLDTDKSGLVDKSEIRVMVEQVVEKHKDKLKSEAEVKAQIEVSNFILY